MFHLLASRRPTDAVRRWRPSAPRRLLRRPAVWWGIAAVLAVATAAGSHRLLADAEAQRRAWAERRVVVVATSAIEPGAMLSSANASLVELPTVALPDRFLTEIPAGATVAAAIERGEIVHPVRLIGGRSTDDERVAIAVPVGDLDGLLASGDVVDVWAAADAYLLDAGSASSRRIAASATVIDRADGVALLALDPLEVAGVAASLPTSSITLTIVSRSAE